MSEIKLNDAPSDGITSLSFSPLQDALLLASSWDGTVAIYDTESNKLVQRWTIGAPVLCACWVPREGGAADAEVWCGDASGAVSVCRRGDAQPSLIGSHSDAVKCCVYHQESDVVMTGGWDGVVRAWDAARLQLLAETTDLPAKVYTMDVNTNSNVLVVGTQNLMVYVYDCGRTRERGTLKLLQKRESSLAHQTRCVSCFSYQLQPGDASTSSDRIDGFALSSIEGRVAVEYLDPSDDAQQRKYAFKCHRSKAGDREVLYPVNAISFHPRFAFTFATGGCDGFVNIWDGRAKKRLMQLRKMATSVAALSWSRTGHLLAIASSYTWEQGEPAQPIKDEIIVRRMQDHECMPKSAGVAASSTVPAASVFQQQ